MCGDERFENHDPAVAGCALQQCVCKVGDADVQLIGAVDQVVKVFLLGSADFVRRGLADGFADGRPGRAVLRGGDPVRQRLSRHVTEEEVEVVDGEAGGVMVESGWGEPVRTIKMSLAAGRRVVPSARMGRVSRRRRRSRTAVYNDQDPVGEFMRRPNKT